MFAKFDLPLAVLISNVFLLRMLVTVTASPHPETSDNVLDTKTPSVFGSNHSKDFRYLGNVDGKSYFVDRIYLNWTAASDFCQSYNLKLASIETEEQWKFLTETLSDIYNLWYWTSARESRTPSMFVWNDTEAQLDSCTVGGWNDYFANGKNYEYCASLRVRANQTSEMYPESCSARNCVLCQN